MKPETLYRLVCRPALPKDTAEVMAFTARIWDGSDYVPYVWEEWLEDPEGLLAVAEFGGKVVGLFMLIRQPAEDWWLQGLRVDPDFQGRGIAKRLHKYARESWERIGGGYLRLTTNSNNKAVQHLCEHTGMRNVSEVTAYSAPSLAEPFRGWRRLEEQEAPSALEYALASPSLSLCEGLIDLEWEWASLKLVYLEEAFREGQAWLSDNEDGLLVAKRYEDNGTWRLHLKLLACPLDSLTRSLLDLMRLAAEMGLDKARWIAPVKPEIQSALIEAGYERDWDMSLFIYEKQHPGAA